mmetsp:Transcript_15990/g.33799  ORF Transcript_15990/g.33799 Transcript_15990/m.33799 type:complete len:237 (+) Transcript_15990:117-827(+)
MSTIPEDPPSRSTQRTPRRSRPQTFASDNGPVVETAHQQQQRSSISSVPQPLTPDSKDSCFFDFFYQIIFWMVHLSLSTVLSPILGKDRTPPTKESSSQSSSSPPKMDDPELAMPENNSVVANGCSESSSSSSYPPILKTESRRCSDALVEKKSVRFPPPERPRPPLGRIGLSSSSVSSCSSSSSRSVSSSESDSSSRSGGRSERSVRNSSRGRRTVSPLGRLSSSRIHHSSYFLE